MSYQFPAPLPCLQEATSKCVAASHTSCWHGVSFRIRTIDMTEVLGEGGGATSRQKSSVQGHPSLSTACWKSSEWGWNPGSMVLVLGVRTNHCACNGGPGPFTYREESFVSEWPRFMLKDFFFFNCMTRSKSFNFSDFHFPLFLKLVDNAHLTYCHIQHESYARLHVKKHI